MGNSAHVFDEFAPKFTDKFHVYALTRRGFGASSQPKDGYNLATLCKDIISVIDHLHLKKVILVGHSIASEEITKLPETTPAKLRRLFILMLLMTVLTCRKSLR
jgi:non-heme chloroperoxidase